MITEGAGQGGGAGRILGVGLQPAEQGRDRLRVAASAVASSTPSWQASWPIGRSARISSTALIVVPFSGPPDERRLSSL